MRYVRFMIGFITILFRKMVMGTSLSFAFPIRVDTDVVLTYRKNGKIQLGKHVSINFNTHLGVTENAVLTIDDKTGIGDNNVIIARERITIGNNVMIGPNVCIYDHDHVFREAGIMRELGYHTAPITIEDNVWIGAGCIILKGVTIGAGSVVAAGTVVTKDIPSGSVAFNRRELVIQERLR